MKKLLTYTSKGIYCEQADVYIDPWKKVPKAFITHGHSDHARPGSSQYICVNESKNILKFRLKTDKVSSFAFGEKILINGVTFSFHPAGHIIGSAQIRVEYKGEIWVVSGDYKTENDKLSGKFESIPCHTFITECTFGLPIFNWKPQTELFEDINNWFGDFIDKKELISLLTPADVSDRSDPKIVHLDGLNLSRATCFYGISRIIENEKIKEQFLGAAHNHLANTLPNIASEHYEGTHYLALKAYTANVPSQ